MGFEEQEVVHASPQTHRKKSQTKGKRREDDEEEEGAGLGLLSADGPIRPVWEEEDAKVEVAVEAAGWEEVEEEAKEAEEAEEEPPPPPVEPPKPTIPPPKLFVQQLSGDGYADLVRHWPPSEDHLDGAASLSAQCEGGMAISELVMKTVDLAMMAYPPPASSTSAPQYRDTCPIVVLDRLHQAPIPPAKWVGFASEVGVVKIDRPPVVEAASISSSRPLIEMDD